MNNSITDFRVFLEADHEDRKNNGYFWESNEDGELHGPFGNWMQVMGDALKTICT